MVPTVEWKDGVVRLLDQSLLPDKVEFVECRDYETVGIAIKELWVRGAPAIGITAAMGVALGAQSLKTTEYDQFRKGVDEIADHLAATRPTAVNLFWAIDRMKRAVEALKMEPIATIKQKLIAEAQAILDEDIAMNRAIGGYGAGTARRSLPTATRARWRRAGTGPPWASCAARGMRARRFTSWRARRGRSCRARG